MVFKQIIGTISAVVMGCIMLGLNAVMFFMLLTLKICLPTRLYWKSTRYVFTQYHWKWLLFHWGKITVVFEGETVPKGETALMICNHQDDLDFGVFIVVYQSQGIRSCETKWISKRSVSFIPFFGWVHKLTGDLFLYRNYETDAERIRSWLSKFHERHFKRIVIFPEGTRSRNKQKLQDSQEFARQHNLPPLNNVLYPRTKGFSLIAQYCKDHPGVVDYIYDYTFGYGGGGVGIWTFLQGPVYTDIHIHLTRHKIQDIGTDSDDFAKFCVKRFQVKDKLLDYFNEYGHFPNAQETAKLERDLEKGKAKVRNLAE